MPVYLLANEVKYIVKIFDIQKNLTWSYQYYLVLSSTTLVSRDCFNSSQIKTHIGISPLFSWFGFGTLGCDRTVLACCVWDTLTDINTTTRITEKKIQLFCHSDSNKQQRSIVLWNYISVEKYTAIFSYSKVRKFSELVYWTSSTFWKKFEYKFSVSSFQLSLGVMCRLQVLVASASSWPWIEIRVQRTWIMDNSSWVGSFTAHGFHFRRHKMRSSRTKSRSWGSAAEPVYRGCGTATMNWSTCSQWIFTECWVDIILVLQEVWKKSWLWAIAVPQWGERLWLWGAGTMPGPPSCSEMWGWFKRPVFGRVSREGAGRAILLLLNDPVLMRAHTQPRTHTQFSSV